MQPLLQRGSSSTRGANSLQRPCHGQATVLSNQISTVSVGRVDSICLCYDLLYLLYLRIIYYCVSAVLGTLPKQLLTETGIFLMKHHVFVNTVNDNVLISLGFRTCAALGIKMMRHECNGSAPWFDQMLNTQRQCSGNSCSQVDMDN